MSFNRQRQETHKVYKVKKNGGCTGSDFLSPNNKPLLQDYSLVYAPSANVFLLCTENAKKKQSISDENLLAIGNPAFDREKNIDLPDLTDAEDEARQLGQIYQQRGQAHANGCLIYLIRY